MTRAIRPSTPEDAPALVALFAQAGLRPNADRQALHWKYWQERADWPRPRSFVLMSGGDLIAHGALVPGTLAWDRHRQTTGHVIDWAARPAELGAGGTILKHIARQVDSLLAIGGSADTLRILPHMGFRAAGVVTCYVRPLHPWRLLRDVEHPTWRLPARLLRSHLWKLAAPAPGSQAWQARRLEGGELDQLGALLPVPAGQVTVLERRIELFRYMLGCPIVPMQLFALENGQRLRGYFLLASAPGQVRIFDCWVDSLQPADWRAMILCAVEQALNDPQAAEAVIWASEPLLSETLSRCGFHARGTLAVRIRPATGALVPPAPIRVQMQDNDAAFVHEGHNEYWA